MRHTMKPSFLLRSAVTATLLAAAMLLPSISNAVEPVQCLSSNPTEWPASSKPYFMIAADTSGSMTTSVGSPSPISSSCGFGSDRRAHVRCAIKNAAQAFSGQVNLGLATYARNQTSCSGACFTGCTYADYPGNQTAAGCGPGTGVNRAGAFIRVPMMQDSFWTTPAAENVGDVLSWVDNSCASSTELFADGQTPINGVLRDMKRYFATGWTAPDSSVSYTTPLSSNDLAGAGVNGGTACRAINVIFITDGDETCDTQTDAVNAAADLYQNGVTVGGKTFKVRTFMINFAGANAALTDQIAAAGGTGASYFANNETEVSTALASIISGAIPPESCDNTDNNCNGCTDEGFAHYGNTNAGCCVAARSTCLANYAASITLGNPNGNVALLPCTSAAQAAAPATWLCSNPGESCDMQDNNINGATDEGITYCGSPLHCPQAEVCNGEDDDCDGVIDEGVCSGCVPSPETCDGCDNDCDGIADDGITQVACGYPSPGNCAGFIQCAPPQPVPLGQCASGGGPLPCNNSPATESCDGVDNDCDGVVDDGVAPAQCDAPGTPPGLTYGGTSQCQHGQQACGSSTCVGAVSASPEVCDGIDNNCDGAVDNGVAGVGQACGINTAPCSAGITTCVGGVLLCQGGSQPQPEICDGIDNDCNGTVDDPPLADQPASGASGCWTLPGSSCSFGSLTWDAPAGATCNGNGTLTAPCSRGTLTCGGGSGWSCIGSRTPSAEQCDGLDNDCDGTDDDGSSICPVGKTCTSGRCQ